MKEILQKCRLNEEEMNQYLEITKDHDPKTDHSRAYRTMMNQTRRELLKFIGCEVRTKEDLIKQFDQEKDQIDYHLSMLEQLHYLMNTKSGWKATPRGIGFLHNAIME